MQDQMQRYMEMSPEALKHLEEKKLTKKLRRKASKARKKQGIIIRVADGL